MPVCSTLLLLSPSALFFPTLHTVPLSLTPFFSPPPFRRTAGARGLSDGFHGYWLQRLDTSGQLPVVVRQPDIKPGALFLRRPSLLHLVLPCLLHRLYYYPFFFVVIFLFPLTLRDIRHNWSQITRITVSLSVISPSPNQPAECHRHCCSADQ